MPAKPGILESESAEFVAGTYNGRKRISIDHAVFYVDHLYSRRTVLDLSVYVVPIFFVNISVKVLNVRANAMQCRQGRQAEEWDEVAPVILTFTPQHADFP